MNPHPPEVLVVTVNYQRPFDTIECITSLQKSSGVKLDFIIVDNGSQDDSASQIKTAFPGIEIHRLEINTGFTGGFNFGIELALKTSSELILLTNNDTLFSPDAVFQLASGLYDIRVPKISYYDQPNRIWAAGARWRKFPPSVVMRGYNQLDSPAFNVPIPLDYATGCTFLANRNVLAKTGGFDNEYRYYMEDYDFFFRAKQSGFSAGYIPSAQVFHKVSRTLGFLNHEQARYMGRNTVFFYRKTKRFSTVQLFTFLTWVSIRESMRGRFEYLFHFLEGAQEGFNTLHSAENKENLER